MRKSIDWCPHLPDIIDAMVWRIFEAHEGATVAFYLTFHVGKRPHRIPMASAEAALQPPASNAGNSCSLINPLR